MDTNELVGDDLTMDDEENPIPISGLWGDLEQSNSNMEIEEFLQQGYHIKVGMYSPSNSPYGEYNSKLSRPQILTW